jgi:hypothetical protein
MRFSPGRQSAQEALPSHPLQGHTKLLIEWRLNQKVENLTEMSWMASEWPSAALRAGLSCRTNGLAFLHLNFEICPAKSPVFLRCGPGRSNEFPALGLRLHQLCRRHIRSVHILHQGFVDSHLRLLLLHLLLPGIITLVSGMGHNARNEIAGRLSRSQDRYAHRLGHLHLVTHMFLLLLALAFDRIGRIRIVGVLHPI